MARHLRSTCWRCDRQSCGCTGEQQLRGSPRTPRAASWPRDHGCFGRTNASVYRRRSAGTFRLTRPCSLGGKRSPRCAFSTEDGRTTVQASEGEPLRFRAQPLPQSPRGHLHPRARPAPGKTSLPLPPLQEGERRPRGLAHRMREPIAMRKYTKSRLIKGTP